MKPGDVGQRADSLVDVVLVGVVDDVLGHALLVAEQALVVVEGGEVAVDHLGMVADTDLKK